METTETKTKPEIKEISWTEKTFLIKRARISFDKLSIFFGEAYGAMYEALKKAGIESKEPPCAIYYSVNEAKNETDLAAAIPVPKSTKEIAGFEMLTIPSSKALKITHYGSYDTMVPSYAELEKHVVDNNLKKEWILEEYLSDPAFEKDPANWRTNIYYLVK